MNKFKSLSTPFAPQIAAWGSLALLCLTPPFNSLAAAEVLWQIGQPDHNNREFALAPNAYRQFTDDALFLVGQSDPKRDWPYVQPGPHDAWAGARQHTFHILFGIKQSPAAGQCQLVCTLLDTQGATPPKLRFDINGHSYERSLPAGSGDASINGDISQCKIHRVALNFPAAQLRSGANEIAITTLSGSWILYDCVALEVPSHAELAPAPTTVVSAIRSIPALVTQHGTLMQPVEIAVRHFGPPIPAVIAAGGTELARVLLDPPTQHVDVTLPAVEQTTKIRVALTVSEIEIASEDVVLNPVRKLTVYILPHSHTDIGYTENQFQVEEKQVQNLIKGLEYARRTQNYPPGAQFKWNVEVLWAADCYLRRLTPEQRTDFLEAVKKGWISLNGMYLNELTGLCRPEELLRLFRYATELAQLCGVTIDSAMISDVPGYTWGTVTAMAHAGIKYFSTAPNYFDRIGNILGQWENKPFYWVSPSGQEKVLVWIPYKGYALSHLIHQLTPEFVREYQSALDASKYPYDIAYLRWSGHGDNAEPDPAISEFVKDWNMRYAWPHFVISSTSEAFHAFEQRYGGQLPKIAGDWTPYWEDGAGSSASETGINRATSDRLAQAETLWAMLAPKNYPAPAFAESWRNTLLYSEHTWGAWCSVSDPENPTAKEQWELKRAYAARADAQSRGLLEQALSRHSPPGTQHSTQTMDIFNTTSWPRTEIVFVPKELSSAGDRVLDVLAQPVPSQRLRDGTLAVLASNIPPLAGQRFTIVSGQSHRASTVQAGPDFLDNGILRVRVDSKTGGIVELRHTQTSENFADTSAGESLNDYLYLRGSDLRDLQHNGPVKIVAHEQGPLIASLLIESDAPGCAHLTRELRLAAGSDYVELVNTVDKIRAQANPKPGDWSFAQKGGKESLNFAFPFNVPSGELRLDVPFGIVRPEKDQIPSACKNWFTVGRWADISNPQSGVTWVTLDAPLVEIGSLTATLLGSQTNPSVWRKHIEPTQRIYSWAMNNHWGTNYRAYQDGRVRFRFILRPHGPFDPAETARFAIGFSQPLTVSRSSSQRLPPSPLLRVEPSGVLVTALKPSDDGHAWIVRLFGASGKPERAKLFWGALTPRYVALSNTSEKPLQTIPAEIDVPSYELVSLRAEF